MIRYFAKRLKRLFRKHPSPRSLLNIRYLMFKKDSTISNEEENSRTCGKVKKLGEGFEITHAREEEE